MHQKSHQPLMSFPNTNPYLIWHSEAPQKYIYRKSLDFLYCYNFRVERVHEVCQYSVETAFYVFFLYIYIKATFQSHRKLCHLMFATWWKVTWYNTGTLRHTLKHWGVTGFLHPHNAWSLWSAHDFTWKVFWNPQQKFSLFMITLSLLVLVIEFWYVPAGNIQSVEKIVIFFAEFCLSHLSIWGGSMISHKLDRNIYFPKYIFFILISVDL